MEEKRTSGRDEDNVRSRGQRELLKREVFIIYLKKVVFHIRAVLIFTILNGRLYLPEVCQSGDEDTGEWWTAGGERAWCTSREYNFLP